MEEISIEEIIDQKVNKLANCTEEDKSQVKSIITGIVATGQAPMQAMDFPEEQVEFLYSCAKELYEFEQYKDANQTFFYLSNLNPQDPRFSFGLAATFHKMKDFKNALHHYLVTAVKDPENPFPWFHAADCYMQTRLPTAASLMLAKAAEIAQNRPEYENLKMQADSLQDFLSCQQQQKEPGT